MVKRKIAANFYATLRTSLNELGLTGEHRYELIERRTDRVVVHFGEGKKATSRSRVYLGLMKGYGWSPNDTLEVTSLGCDMVLLENKARANKAPTDLLKKEACPTEDVENTKRSKIKPTFRAKKRVPSLILDLPSMDSVADVPCLSCPALSSFKYCEVEHCMKLETWLKANE